MFLEPAWISRLAGRFCERYLETLGWYDRGAAQDCGAWHIAYASTASRFTPPGQNALLGFSAHINYDLIFGIHATIVEFGHGDDRAMLARLKHDHDQINTLLRASVIEALARLTARHGCPSARSSWTTRRRSRSGCPWRCSRGGASGSGTTSWRLLAARDGSERAALSRGIERRSTRIAQMLALPSLHQAPHTALRLLSRAA